jgi:NAD(P)-dependent dehydrogenase (short-subunit alcohol dehydrogenase family)
MDHLRKVALITGGAKGIGRAAAEVFIREGASVILLDQDAAAGREAQEMLPRTLFLETDVTQATQVRRAVEEGASHFGGIDYLVNNAGIIHYATAVTCAEEDWDRVLNVNLKAAFLCAKYTIPYLQQRGGGVIVNVASAQSFISSANMVHYTTSKTALLGLTRSLAIDFAPLIRAVAVCPGTVDTPMARNAWATAPDPEAVHRESIHMHLLERIARPGEVGELIAFLCGGKAGFITGQAIRIDGGLGISVPGSVNDPGL